MFLFTSLLLADDSPISYLKCESCKMPTINPVIKKKYWIFGKKTKHCPLCGKILSVYVTYKPLHNGK